jgi:hypothetical protein
MPTFSLQEHLLRFDSHKLLPVEAAHSVMKDEASKNKQTDKGRDVLL